MFGIYLILLMDNFLDYFHLCTTGICTDSFTQFYHDFSYILHCDRDTIIVLTVLADVCYLLKCSLTPANF